MFLIKIIKNIIQKKKLTTNEKSFFLTVLIGTSFLLFFILTNYFDVYIDFERKISNLEFNLIRNTEKLIDEDIILIDIDEYSIKSLATVFGRWPWPKEVQSYLIEFLNLAQPRLICYNIPFSYPDLANPESDNMFMNSVLSSDSIILPIIFTHLGTLAEYKKQALHRFGLKRDWNLKCPEYQNAITPMNELTANIQKLGHNNFTNDPDGPVRKMDLFVKFNGLYYPSLSLVSLCQYYKVSCKDLTWDGSYLTISNADNPDEKSPFRIPMNDEGRTLINYYGHYGTYKVIRFHEMIQAIRVKWGLVQPGSEEAKILRNSFFPGKTLDEGVAKFISGLEDKVILVHLSAAGLLDLKSTPFSQISAGMSINANFINNVIKEDYLQSNPQYLELIIQSIIGILVIFILSKLKPLLAFILVFIILIVNIMVAGYLFYYHSYIYEIGAITLTIAMIYLSMIFLKFFLEQKEKGKVKGAFSHYVSVAIVNEILKNPDKLELGGHRKELSIFFSDVAGFTSISEKLTPEELVLLLNEYLSEMTDIIMNYNGTLDRYEGDAISAFWGAPIDMKNHARLACLAALDNQATLARLRKGWEQSGKPLLNARIGINTGEVIVGNMGAKDKFAYTCLGDEAHHGETLESENKVWGTKLMISGRTNHYVQDELLTRILDIIEVHGEEHHKEVYELISRKENSPEIYRKIIPIYNEAYNYYKDKQWSKSKELFTKVLSIKEDDIPSQIYIKRCDYLEANSVDGNWTGFFNYEI